MKINTSINISKWNLARIQNSHKKIHPYPKLYPSTGTMVRLCLREMMNHFPGNLLQRYKARLYNRKSLCYTKCSIEFPLNLYNIIHFHAHKARISVSFLTDVAIFYFLNIVLNKISGANENNIDASVGKYQAKIQNINYFTWILQEIWEKPREFLYNEIIAI